MKADLVVQWRKKDGLKQIRFKTPHDDMGVIFLAASGPITVLSTSPWPGYVRQVGNHYVWEGERYPGPGDLWNTQDFVLETTGEILAVLCARREPVQCTVWISPKES